MSADQTLAPSTPLDATPVNRQVPNDLAIQHWIDSGDTADLALGISSARSVGEVWNALYDWLMDVPETICECPLVFVAADNRMYAAQIIIEVRLATPDEVYEAVQNARDCKRYTAECAQEDRIGNPNCHTGTSGM